MLDMGFIPDIERIFQLTPFTRQTLFFSATMAPEIERITDTFLHTPERIEVARQATASETITQKLVELAPTRRDMAARQKRDLLRTLIDAEGEALTNAIIFCNRKTDVDIVAKSLAKHGYDAAPIHGDLDQSHRTRTLDRFREGKLRLLVASDVAARGLDIPAVSHVFNFDMPSHAEDYVHRIGRTGRAGRAGTAFSIATPADEKYLSAIEGLVKTTLPRAPLPEGFSPSETDRPAVQDERRSGRDRRRGQQRDEGRSDAGREVSRPEKTASEEPRRDNTSRDSDTRGAPRREPAREARRDEARDDRRESPRGQRGRRDGGSGPVLMGLGDHVPDFMLVELRPALASVSRDAAIAPAAPEAAAGTADALAEQPQRGRGRRRKAEKPAIPAGPAEAAAPELPPLDPQPAEGAAPEPAPAVRDDATPPSGTAQDAEAAAPKPKRTRRKKAEGEVKAEEAPAPVEKPKPTRRKKTADAVEPAAPDLPEGEPKPKRTRRRKSDALPEAQLSADADA